MQALQAFDAVARNGSVLRAAQALHLTHGAISHAIKGLEESIGVRLFARVGRRIRLTEAGEEFALRVGDCLRGIESAITQATKGHSHSLVVLVDASFASRWLAPRIGDYIAAHPEHDLHLKTSQSPERHFHEADIALCYLSDKTDEAECELLLEDALFPVCSGGLAECALRKPADLANCNLLRTYSEQWTTWFAAADLNWPEPAAGAMFADAAHALQTAAAGGGVALARRSLVSESDLSLELVRPFQISARAERNLYFVRPLIKSETPAGRVFQDWVREEFRSTFPDVFASVP